jgi:hypothetical protein
LSGSPFTDIGFPAGPEKAPVASMNSSAGLVAIPVRGLASSAEQ